MNGDDGLLLAGLAGENPLAALAALGTLRVLDLAWPGRGVRLAWRLVGTWRPVLSAEGGCSRAEVVGELDRRLRGRDGAPEFTLAGPGGGPRELTLTAEEFAEVARRAAGAATGSDRAWADFCAAFGTDAVAGRRDGQEVQATAFRFTSGQQKFLGSIRELAFEPAAPPPPVGKRKPRQAADKGTSAIHLERALFEPWSYSDPKPSLRWDPADDRRHAMRALDPSDTEVSPILTVRGANRLAVEALPWLPTFGQGGEAATRGWNRRGEGPSWTWPIWGPSLAAATVASLLGLAELGRGLPARDALLARGIVEVYRARRVGDYYGNFSPGVASWGRGVLSSGYEP
jgi:hypothetical protein